VRTVRLLLVAAGFAGVLAVGSAQPALSDAPRVPLAGHDSRDPLYRAPGGAVTTGTDVRLRFRTYHGDADSVTVRSYSTAAQAEKLVDMHRIAVDVPCGVDNGADCDFWEATIDSGDPGTIYYRFIVESGSKTTYYEDDSDVRDGGWGKYYDTSPDWGWAITVYDPGFKPVEWMQNGLVYQIFPDRFRNGTRRNDPARGNPRKYVWSKAKRYAYPHGDPQHESTPALDRVVRMPWGALPEGYCRGYADALQTCPKRFPPKGQGTEGPHGRDYYGGDLAGITQKLAYLKGLGVTVLYLNPIFWAGSNHRYDTRDYAKIDPWLGSLRTFRTLTRKAHRLGMKVVLDGVFNHMSSDSPFFDRYHNWKGQGACESASSDWRGWFTFRKPAGGEPSPCKGGQNGESYYNSWFGFDSLPQLTEVFGVRDYVDSVAKKWLRAGADGWRLDVMQEKSVDFWHEFRSAVEATKKNSIIIGELWKKFDVLPYVHGDTADTSMDYRFRDAVIGLLAPHPFDSKGFPGSGQPLAPTAFVDRLESIREDYPDATYWTLMNLIDSHDTERALWTLTPGVETRAERERNVANVAEGKKRLRLAALIQMTMPGAPTIYYGDEVGVTGDDDPDDRRTYPWGDRAARRLGDRRKSDTNLRQYYRSLADLRKHNPVLRDGKLTFLLADDSAGTLAYGRKEGNGGAVVVLNPTTQAKTVAVPVAGYLPDGTALGGGATVQSGKITVSLGALEGSVLFTSNADLTPPAAPTGLTATAHGLGVALSWMGPPSIDGVAGYNVYRSPVSGGGYVKVNDTPVSGVSFTDSSPSLLSGVRFYYVVKALDSVGNESEPSNEASAVPSYPIAGASLDRPPALDYTVSAVNTTDPVYGRVLITGVTSGTGQTPGVLAQLGYGAPGTDPATWTWVDISYSADAGDQDEYSGTLHPETPGTYSYLVRFSTSQGESWVYGDLDGGASGTDKPGTLTVHPNPDQTPPPAPTGLTARSRGSSSIGLSWTGVSASDLYGYEIYRSTTSASGYQKIAFVDASTTKYTDTGLTTGTTYYYVVKALDEADNRSAASNEASATPAVAMVDVTFVVTPPATTPADKEIYIAGNQPQLCNWCNEHTVVLTKGADGKWRVTLSFAEGTALEYKYTLGTWDYVMKGASCDELPNNQAKVAPQNEDGTMTIEDTVKNWRNVPPCGS
jgi:glycosidase